MYQASEWGELPSITEVAVTRETENSVWFDGKLRRKESEGEAYFHTWAEAKDWLVTRAVARLETTMKRLKRENDRLDALEAMQPPKGVSA